MIASGASGEVWLTTFCLKIVRKTKILRIFDLKGLIKTEKRRIIASYNNKSERADATSRQWGGIGFYFLLTQCKI